MNLPPNVQNFYDKVGEQTKTPEWEAFNKDVGAAMDKHLPNTLTLTAMIAKFIDIMESKQPGIGQLVVTVLAHRVRLPLLDIESGDLVRLRRI
jgi:hypothetical protein